MKSFVRDHSWFTGWENEHGQFHREDGPAIEWYDGANSWWINGIRHRINGPAVKRADGVTFWIVYDIHIKIY